MDEVKKRVKKYQINDQKRLSDEEQVALLKNIKKMIAKDPNKAMIVLLALKTGARRGELLNIKVSYLDVFKHTIFIEGTKGSKDRTIPLEPWVVKEIVKYIDRGQYVNGDKLFPFSTATAFRQWNDLRPVPKKFHSLRHTFAINLFKAHKDLQLVRTALGHENILNTMVYAEYVYSTEEMRKLIYWDPETA